MRHRSSRLARVVLGTLTVALGATGTSEAAVTTFPNPAPITLTDGTFASPYPSAVSVAGLCGTVTAVRVTLTGLSHGASKDVDVLLVSPGGEKVMLLSDAGGAASAVTLTFDDAASASVPSTSIATGLFRPTNYADAAGTGNDTFPAGVPAGAVFPTLGAFAGGAPNGTWRLFARDDHAGTAGSISGGWSLRLLTPNCPVVPVDPGDGGGPFDDGDGGLDPEEGGGSFPLVGPKSLAPKLSALKMSPGRFKASRRGGTKVSFSLSRAGKVTFSVERRTKGRRSGKKCVKRRRANRARKICTRWVKVDGSIGVNGKQGTNSFTFRGKLGGRNLKPGGYRMTGRAKGGTAVARREFTVIR